MRTILFVCTGNICRSPMAEAFPKRILAREGQATVKERKILRRQGILVRWKSS